MRVWVELADADGKVTSHEFQAETRGAAIRHAKAMFPGREAKAVACRSEDVRRLPARVSLHRRLG